MNVNTGEIARLYALSDLEKNLFEPVPDQYAEEADALLKNEDRVFADMSKDTPLINWAKDKAKDKAKKKVWKNRTKRKIAKMSKRKNRKPK